MVVLAILGLAAAAVVLTLPAANGGAMAEADRFAARVANLRDHAILDGRSYGLWVSASGYGFEQRRDGKWQALEDGRLARSDWRAGTVVLVDGAAQGRLTFNRIGITDAPMRVTVRAGETRATVAIDAGGEVRVE